MEDLKLHDAVVFLAAAGVVIPIVRRLKISPVLGFILVGLIVGPYGLGRFVEVWPALRFLVIADIEGVAALAELGVVFLLFMIGLELSLERLWSMRRLVFGMGGLQIVVTGLVIFAIAVGFGNSVQVSVLLGSCLALSSTAIVMQLLVEQSRFGSAVGRGSFAILLAQDIAVVPVLFLVGTFGRQSDSPLFLELGLAFGGAFLAVAVILGLGRLIVRPLFRFVGTDGAETFMAVTLLTIVATAAATHAVGLSAALGAFLAGLLLAESEYRHEIEVSIAPFKGLLLGLFFMSVAMSIDLAAILANPVWISLSVLGLFLIKAAITTVLARVFGFSWGQSAETGLLLGQGGEFAFVVLALALSLGLVPPATAQFMLVVVGATMVLTPGVAKLARIFGARLDAGRSMDEIIAPGLSGHVIIVGYGRTGALLANLLDRQRIQHVALDLDPERVTQFSADGAPVMLGDAGREAMLEKVQLRTAAALAVCTDDADASSRVLHAARRMAREIPIVVRARDAEHGSVLIEAGATRVVPEVFESGLHLGQVLFEQLGLPPAVARDLIDSQRVASEIAMDLRRSDP